MNPRPKEATAHDERRAWQLRCQLWTQQRIADELGLDASTICKMLQRKERALAAEFKEQAEEIKARQTATLETLADELFAQWLRSCEDAESVTVTEGRFRFNKETGEATPLPDERKTTRSGQSGNPALLEKAMKALADIRAIWGLDAPKRTDVTGVEPQKIVILTPGEADKV